MHVVARDAPPREFLQLFVGLAGDHDERGVELLEDVPVLLQQEAKELLCIVGDEVELEAGVLPLDLHGFLWRRQAQHLFCGQEMASAEVPVRVPRGEPVQVRTANGGEEQRIGVGGGRSLYSVRDLHASSPKAPRRARTR